MSYKKTLETISKIENVENIKKLISKPRLSIFREICDDKIFCILYTEESECITKVAKMLPPVNVGGGTFYIYCFQKKQYRRNEDGIFGKVTITQKR